MPTRFLHDCRRSAARTLIRANVPERVAMRLTGHASRAIFDRYHIIHEQERLNAGDPLVACLAQHAQATPRWRAHPASAAPPLRLVRRTTAYGWGPSGEMGLDTRQTPGQTRPAHCEAHSRPTARDPAAAATPPPATPPHKGAHTATGGTGLASGWTSDATVERPPATRAAATVFRSRPRTCPDDGQTRAVEHEMGRPSPGGIGRRRRLKGQINTCSAPAERPLIGR